MKFLSILLLGLVMGGCSDVSNKFNQEQVLEHFDLSEYEEVISKGIETYESLLAKVAPEVEAKLRQIDWEAIKEQLAEVVASAKSNPDLQNAIEHMNATLGSESAIENNRLNIEKYIEYVSNSFEKARKVAHETLRDVMDLDYERL
jgi:hypothetical protein